METQARPFVWQMIREALEVHGNRTTNIAVKDWVLAHYPDINVNTLLNNIIICTVNHEARVHYRENQRPRRCNEKYDLLFRPSPGKLELYDPRLHGVWEIVQNEQGVLTIREIKEDKEHTRETAPVEGYIDSTRLRSYLAKNLELIEPSLEIYVDLFGNIGVGYPTEFGEIDLLAIDKHGAFVIIEIKRDYSTDESSGQILKFKNWVKRHLANGKPVRSYLVGPEIPEHVRYSLAECGDVFLKEYDLSIRFKDVPKINELGTPIENPPAIAAKQDKGNKIESIAA